ncbi:hypothetical protein HPB47_026346 [Ixodes persulcatus]|uniref:Uncharacterized protein n=1 Tax=Ixodes persulcatus TaxID=34615 RepID=A0AC60Q0Y6_IXOPE|nr:hypothetical protein HPB47_026346 [Ixodes persulcatus]
MDCLSRTRGVVRSAVTRTISQLNHLIQNPNTTEIDSRLLLDYLIQERTSLADLDRGILTLTTDDDLGNEIEGSKDYPTWISHDIARFLYALDKLKQPTNIATRVANIPTDTLQPSGFRSHNGNPEQPFSHRNCPYSTSSWQSSKGHPSRTPGTYLHR